MDSQNIYVLLHPTVYYGIILITITIMRKYLLFIFFALFSFSTIDAQIEWTLSEDSTLTISGTSMPDYKFKYFFTRKDTTIAPWYRKSGSIKKIVIKEGVTRIGMWAFRNCYSVSSVEMPNSLTNIADHAFDNCHNITSVTIPNSVTSIGEQAFYNCSSLTSITIPESVTSIGESAFARCEALTSITIPNSVNSIGGLTFGRCYRLASITIPKSVMSIGEQAFVSCINLKSITFEGSTPPKFGEDVFKDVNSTIRVYVPADCIQAYRMAMKRYLRKISIQAL